jgi:hypothetical protein
MFPLMALSGFYQTKQAELQSAHPGRLGKF